MSVWKHFHCMLTVIFFLLLTSSVFSQNEQTPQDSTSDQVIQEISVHKARKMIEAKKGGSEFVILDLRTSQEYKEEHIENSQNIDFFSENFRNNLNKLDKDTTYIIHCRSGKRAGKTAPIMKELGFKKVYNMGGILQWKDAGFNVITTN